MPQAVMEEASSAARWPARRAVHIGPQAAPTISARELGIRRRTAVAAKQKLAPLQSESTQTSPSPRPDRHDRRSAFFLELMERRKRSRTVWARPSVPVSYGLATSSC